MKSLIPFVGIALSLVAGMGLAWASDPQTSSSARTTERPYVVAYYYKVKWGYLDEFLRLFKKNHWPILKAEQEQGKILRVEAYTPTFHGEGRADWHFMTVIVYRNWNAVIDQTGREALIRRLYPDQQKFQAEEQRRFELLEAHWDVPLTGVDLDR
ncbi:MAG TPA: hypothetical protein VNM72_11965 [Blastocatellia bacterium]|nr:hypothetical protein [Blastocatellia bacterium]